MEKDASGASAARGSFWPMRKFGTRNKKKIVKSLRSFILDVEIRQNDANYGNPGIQNAVNTI